MKRFAMVSRRDRLSTSCSPLWPDGEPPFSLRLRVKVAAVSHGLVINSHSATLGPVTGESQ